MESFTTLVVGDALSLSSWDTRRGTLDARRILRREPVKRNVGNVPVDLLYPWLLILQNGGSFRRTVVVWLTDRLFPAEAGITAVHLVDDRLLQNPLSFFPLQDILFDCAFEDKSLNRDVFFSVRSAELARLLASRFGSESARSNLGLQGDGVLVDCVNPLVVAASEQFGQVECHLFPPTKANVRGSAVDDVDGHLNSVEHVLCNWVHVEKVVFEGIQAKSQKYL